MSGSTNGGNLPEKQVRLLLDKVRLACEFDKTNAASYAQYLQVIDHVKGSCTQGYTKGAKNWKPHPLGAITKGSTPIGDEEFVVTFGSNHGKLMAWFEFNLDKLTDKGLTEVAGALALMLDEGGKSLLTHGAISRYEVAVDVPHARFGDYLFLDRSLRVDDAKLVPKGTYYLGNDSGKRHFSIYDKAKEQLERHGKKLNHELLRVEAIINCGSSVPVSQWAQLPNPFSSLVVIDKQALTAAKGLLLSALRKRMSVKQCTAQQAYLSFTKHERAELWQLSGSMAPEWWEPSAIWNDLPGVLGRLQLLKGMYS